MNFTLRLFDTDLLKFSANENSANPDYKINFVNEDEKALLPLGFEISEKGLESWIKNRTIPKNRAFMDSFLAKCGLSSNRPLSIVYFSKGLSLNDCYWVVPEGFTGKFDEYNLFENRFSRILSYIAFTGFGSSIRSSFNSSPEFSTNGMLPKCWRRIDSKIVLYKGGTSGASNTGFEPYSEFYAYQIASALGFDAISYGLSKWKENLCSTCELFTSKKYSYVPAGRVIKTGGFEAVREFYRSLGTEFEQSLNEMLIFDAIIKNVDRHFGNFGFLVNSSTNKIEKPAPLFDHGNSLYNLAGIDDFENIEKLSAYDKVLQPSGYDDFSETAKKVLNDEYRQKLRKLLDFHFKKHSKYNLDSKRLNIIEEQIKKNIQILLK